MRPQTYEDATESALLKSLLRGRDQLENTVFALLDPDGEPLTRGARSPRMTYRTVDRFAAALRRTAVRYEADAAPIAALPVVRDLRLALNVAAADLRPLVVVRGADEDAARALAAKVASFAWSKLGVGRFHYVVLADEQTFEGLTPEVGVTVVQPEAYGRGGDVLAHVPASAGDEELGAQMVAGLCSHDVGEKDHEQHVQQGRRARIYWQHGDLPPTDEVESRRRRRR